MKVTSTIYILIYLVVQTSFFSNDNIWKIDSNPTIPPIYALDDPNYDFERVANITVNVEQ
jgi:hypothetical protein